jgi:hypothetical protein
MGLSKGMFKISGKCAGISIEKGRGDRGFGGFLGQPHKTKSATVKIDM